MRGWLGDDLADIEDPGLVAELQDLTGSVTRHLTLKEAFLAAYFSQDRVEGALARAAHPASELLRRLGHREPLPTLDALAVLAPDPTGRAQLERAAALAHAALGLHASGGARGSALLGQTQVPGACVDRLVHARGSSDLAVLVDGRPYLVPAAARRSLDELSAALAEILADAPTRAPSRPLGALTAASRPVCHALRARLLADPEGARTIAAIEGAAVVLCLDGAAAPAPASLADAARGLFSRRSNRWYGAPQIVVDAGGNAGVIEGYTRGIGATELVAFAVTLALRSQRPVRSGPGAGTPGPISPLLLSCDADDPLLRAAEAEAKAAFHDEACMYSLAVERAWFKAQGLSPNAALQILLILAAHDTWGGATSPTLTQAVRRGRADETLDWVVAPTDGLAALRAGWQRSDRSLALFRRFAARLAERVDACRRAGSPALLVSQPHGERGERLTRLFMQVAAGHDSMYRGYLFRATRAAGTIDMITSTVALPDGVAYVGRPGATSQVAARFGLHVLPRAGSTDLIYIPNRRYVGDLPRFHARLEHWLGELRAALENNRRVDPL